MEKALVAHLAANGITNVFPQIAPQNAAKPYVVYTAVTNLPLATQDGTLKYRQGTIQIDVYAATYAAARELATTIEGLADGFKGEIAGTTIQGTFPQGQRDLPATNVVGSSEPIRRRSQDWVVHYLGSV